MLAQVFTVSITHLFSILFLFLHQGTVCQQRQEYGRGWGKAGFILLSRLVRGFPVPFVHLLRREGGADDKTFFAILSFSSIQQQES